MSYDSGSQKTYPFHCSWMSIPMESKSASWRDRKVNPTPLKMSFGNTQFWKYHLFTSPHLLFWKGPLKINFQTCQQNTFGTNKSNQKTKKKDLYHKYIDISKKTPRLPKSFGNLKMSKNIVHPAWRRQQRPRRPRRSRRPGRSRWSHLPQQRWRSRPDLAVCQNLVPWWTSK